ncbi:putative membrane protein [Candidatus Rickettsiella viridis]|uniref:Putative membrane protein n=1 Tax=Candidatus Rickettsiella viridis TaxID=676208 RepID=A0A2Z5UUA0_9COXI|nr:hypothetical protein [Candidatus Rickettsiella viridis]BBB14625.1 putative membrane protein [Candidatus Rickettsiella viridis]
MKKKDAIRILKNISSVTLGVTQVIVDGLSSVRQIGDFTSASWAKGASGTASVVEGEIYRKNIFEGLGLFSLLSQKGLSKYLILQALETELSRLKEYEEAFKQRLHCFFTAVKKDREDKGDAEALDEIRLLENSVLEEKEVDNFFSFFETFKEKRFGTSKFIEFSLPEQFKQLQEEFKQLKEIKKQSTCAFLTSYKANKTLLETAESLGLKKPEIEQAEKRLKVLQKMLVERVSDPKKWVFIPGEDINPALLTKLQKELSIGKRRLWPLRLSMLFSASAGLAVGIVTFYTFPAVLTGLGLSLSLTALSAIIWPLAILAAISYGILIYNTMADLIVNETLSKWWRALNAEIGQGHHPLKYAFRVVTKALSQLFIKLAQWFRVKPEENGFVYSLRIILSLLMVSFAVMAALTTGYTAFTQLQSYLSVVVGVIIALPLMISDLTFTLKNSFESIALLSGISLANLTDPIKEGWKKLQEQLARENYFQLTLHLLRLPLELLLSVFKAAIFCLHVIFISVASDRLFSLPCWVTLIFTAGSEFLTDICPIFGKKEAGAGHDHDHGGIISWIAKAVFFVPATILGLLNYLFSQLNRLSSNPEHKLEVLGCWAAIQQEWNQFDIRHLHEEKDVTQEKTDDISQKAELPNQIVLQKAIKICDKQIDRLDHGFFSSKLAKDKKEIFKSCKATFIEACEKGTNVSSIKIDVDKDGILAKHRFFNRDKQTESARQLEKIQYWLAGRSAATSNHNASVLMTAA